MLMAMFALRVLGAWFCFGVALGLCWTAACFTARAIVRLRSGGAQSARARGLLSALVLPLADAEAAYRGAPFSVGLGLPALALPRRLGQRLVPARDTLVRAPIVTPRLRKRA